jgi:hypothetical protein
MPKVRVTDIPIRLFANLGVEKSIEREISAPACGHSVEASSGGRHACSVSDAIQRQKSVKGVMAIACGTSSWLASRVRTLMFDSRFIPFSLRSPPRLLFLSSYIAAV